MPTSTRLASVAVSKALSGSVRLVVVHLSWLVTCSALVAGARLVQGSVTADVVVGEAVVAGSFEEQDMLGYAMVVLEFVPEWLGKVDTTGASVGRLAEAGKGQARLERLAEQLVQLHSQARCNQQDSLAKVLGI